MFNVNASNPRTFYCSITWGKSMNRLMSFGAVGGLAALISLACHGQPLTLDEVKNKAEPLTAEQVQALAKGSKVEFRLVNGSTRMWSHDDDGTFIASRVTARGYRSTGRGTWKVGEKGEYCLTFDWGATETENWCRLLYLVDDRYYAFSPDAKGETNSGQYYFKR